MHAVVAMEAEMPAVEARERLIEFVGERWRLVCRMCASARTR